MPYALAVRQINSLFKIVELLDEPDMTSDLAEHRRKSYALVHNIPITNIIVVYSD